MVGWSVPGGLLSATLYGLWEILGGTGLNSYDFSIKPVETSQFIRFLMGVLSGS
jgi:hypothetical protein